MRGTVAKRLDRYATAKAPKPELIHQFKQEAKKEYRRIRTAKTPPREKV